MENGCADLTGHLSTCNLNFCSWQRTTFKYQSFAVKNTRDYISSSSNHGFHLHSFTSETTKELANQIGFFFRRCNF